MNGQLVLPDPEAAVSAGIRGFVEVPGRTARKRHRPALSCVQCRRRKVKCDRKLPCSQCSQYNNTACLYDDPEVVTRGKPADPTPQTLHNSSTTLPSNQSYGHRNPRQPIIFSTPLTAAPTNLDSRSPTTSVPWGSAPPTEHAQSEHNASEKSIGVRTPQSDASTQELKDRVQKLEAIISSSSNYGSRPENDSNISSTKVPKLRGNIDKTRFFGMSHWMNTDDEFPELRALKHYDAFDNGSELQKLLNKCKDMARVVKAERPISSYTTPDFKSHIPSREIADQLVQLYFRTFESTYRILHRVLFFKEYEQYWKDPNTANTGFVAKLLLVTAIGTVFYDDGTNGDTLRSLAPQWICAAQTWLSAPFEKSRLNHAGIEVQCLLILARHTHSFESDLLWVTSGTLFRTAMSMGLHRDPSHFPKISVFNAEHRRRLWATIIELATQSSLDCGMPPMFSFHDFDCEPPSNYDDTDIDEQTKKYPPKKPDSVFTDTSLQRKLHCSLPTRLEISRLINDFRSFPPYEKVLALSNDLTSHIRSYSTLYQSSQLSTHNFSTCHKNLLDLFSRRFMLALHHPFAIQAKTDPRFYFSRKMALDAAMAILSHSASETGDPAEEFAHTRLLTGGIFQESISRASSTIALELSNQINEDTSSGLSRAGENARKPLHDALELLVGLVRKRIEYSVETNVKGYLFVCMVHAQTVAMERGEDVREAITEKAKLAAEEAFILLRNRVKRTPLDGQFSTEREGSGEVGENNVDWDLLMQDTMMDFDGANHWLFDSWEDAHNLI